MNWDHSTSNIQELVADSTFTHFIHFAIGLRSDGTYWWDPQFPDSLNALEEISLAHPAGIKVLIEIFPHIQEMTDAWSTLSGRKSSINKLMNIVRNMNFDGTDWDMETGYTSTWGTFSALLKDSLNAVGAQMGKPLTNSVWTYGNAQSEYTAGQWQYFDRIQIEAYEQSGAWPGWIVWNGYGVYSRGITLPCYPYIPVTGIDSSWTVWKRLGVPDSVLVISQAASGRIWQGGTMVANVLGFPTRGGAYQQGDVWTGSYPPNCSDPYLGMPTVSTYEISYLDIMTTYGSYPTTYDTLAISSAKSVDNTDDANDKFITFADPWVFYKQYRYMVDVRNGGGMSVWAPIDGRMSAGNYPIHDAIKLARDNAILPATPSGTFSAVPDTFPAGGGTTTLTWTSANATIVTISPAIGVVTASGNRAVGVSSSMDFVLTVSNSVGVAATYGVHIGVVPSGSGNGLVVVDSFNRANSTSLGSGWAVPSGRASCGIVNAYYTPGGQICVPNNCGMANGANGRGFNYRTETFSNDQYAEITPKAVLPGYRYVYAGVRMGGAMGEGYYAKTDGASALLVKINNAGTETILQNLGNTNFTEYGSDRMKIQITGNLIKVFKNNVQVSLDLTDNSITSGHPGISTTPDNNSALDNFQGGGLDTAGQVTTPMITLSASSLTFSPTVPETSAVQSYTVTGSYLMGSINISMSGNNFQISTNSGSGWTNTLTLTQSGGNVSRMVYVRSIRIVAGTSIDTLRHTSTGATTRTLGLSTTATVRTIFVQTIFGGVFTSATFRTIIPAISNFQQYRVWGTGLTGQLITVSVIDPDSVNFQLSLDGVSWSRTVTDDPSLFQPYILVRFNRSTVGSATARIRHTATGAPTVYVGLTGLATPDCSVYQLYLNRGDGQIYDYRISSDTTLYVLPRNPDSTEIYWSGFKEASVDSGLIQLIRLPDGKVVNYRVTHKP
jgi:hypothetical protein